LKIRTRLVVIALLPIAMAAVVAFGFGVASRLLDREAREGRVAEEIARGIFELNFLMTKSEVTLSPHDLRRWKEKHESLGKVLSEATFGDAEEQGTLNLIREEHRRIGNLFVRLIEADKAGRRGDLLAREQRALIAGIIKYGALEKFYDADLLVEKTSQSLREIQRKSDAITMTLILGTAVLVGFWSLYVSRTLRRSVSGFQEATQALADGNLDFHIESPGRNEFGRLAWAFNEMADKLRRSYSELTSTAEMLGHENQERRRAEEELRLANRELETRVAERTSELSRTIRMLEQASRHSDRMMSKVRLQAERQKEYDWKLEELFELSRRMLMEGTTERTLQAIIDSARRLLGARYCLTGHGFVGGRFQIDITSRTADASPCPPGRVFNVERGGVYLEIVGKGKVLRLADRQLREHPAWWGLPEGHAPLRGLLGVPLLGGDGIPMGLIMVSDKVDGSDFTDDDERLLKKLATLASAALVCVEDSAGGCAPPPLPRD
jgi:HAMP domain-containing protein